MAITGDNGVVVTHRVVRVAQMSDGIYFATKGDANAASDPVTVKASFSAFGTVTNHIGVFTPTNCIVGTSRN